jgi:hypothetical protein
MTEVKPLFDPVAYVRDIEALAKEGGWTVRHLSPVHHFTRPWLQRAAHTSTAPAPAVYLSAGIHGDEIAGPIAVLEMLRRPGFFDDFDTTIFPILNPHGLSVNQRFNAAGLDLNRDYREPKSPEITSHLEVLRTLGHFDAAVYLHEDFEGIGAYLYELNESLDPDLGAKIMTAMGRHVPIDLRPEIEEVPATGGIINRSNLVAKLGPIEDRPEWPEAIYLRVRHEARASYTTETPMPFPLPDRVNAQIAAVEAVLLALRLEKQAA